MNLLSRVSPGFFSTALRTAVPNFAVEAGQVIDDWFLLNLVAIGTGRLLADVNDPVATKFLTIDRSEITSVVNQDPGRVNSATQSTVLTDSANHEFCLLILLSVAAFEQADLNGLGHKWQEVRAMFTRILRSAERLDGVRKEAATILDEVGDRLPTGHPALEVLGAFAN